MTTPAMRAAGITRVGGAVEMLDLAEPRRIASDEVLIAVKAAGVGNWDEIVRTGGWDVGRQPPLALGVEAAGVVEAVGDQVEDRAVGDEVMTHPLPLRHSGAWAHKLVASAALTANKPTNISFEAAAAFPVPALTAEQVLAEALAIGEGEWLLVHGGSGVTGGLIVQLAVAKGAAVVTTAGPTRADRLRTYGARAILDYHDSDWPTKVQRLTDGAGVPAAVNTIRNQAHLALQAVTSGGRLATITGDPPQPDRDITIANVYVRPDGDQLAALAELLAAGVLTVPIAATYPIENAPEALTAAVAGHAGGAIVLSMPRTQGKAS